MVCDKCGYNSKPDALFCMRCGNRLLATDSVEDPQPDDINEQTDELSAADAEVVGTDGVDDSVDESSTADRLLTMSDSTGEEFLDEPTIVARPGRSASDSVETPLSSEYTPQPTDSLPPYGEEDLYQSQPTPPPSVQHSPAHSFQEPFEEAMAREQQQMEEQAAASQRLRWPKRIRKAWHPDVHSEQQEEFGKKSRLSKRVLITAVSLIVVVAIILLAFKLMDTGDGKGYVKKVSRPVIARYTEGTDRGLLLVFKNGEYSFLDESLIGVEQAIGKDLSILTVGNRSEPDLTEVYRVTQAGAELLLDGANGITLANSGDAIYYYSDVVEDRRSDTDLFEADLCRMTLGNLKEEVLVEGETFSKAYPFAVSPDGRSVAYHLISRTGRVSAYINNRGQQIELDDQVCVIALSDKASTITYATVRNPERVDIYQSDVKGMNDAKSLYTADLGVNSVGAFDFYFDLAHENFLMIDGDSSSQVRWCKNGQLERIRRTASYKHIITPADSDFTGSWQYWDVGSRGIFSRTTPFHDFSGIFISAGDRLLRLNDPSSSDEWKRIESVEHITTDGQYALCWQQASRGALEPCILNLQKPGEKPLVIDVAAEEEPIWIAGSRNSMYVFTEDETLHYESGKKPVEVPWTIMEEYIEYEDEFTSSSQEDLWYGIEKITVHEIGSKVFFWFSGYDVPSVVICWDKDSNKVETIAADDGDVKIDGWYPQDDAIYWYQRSYVSKDGQSEYSVYRSTADDVWEFIVDGLKKPSSY